MGCGGAGGSFQVLTYSRKQRVAGPQGQGLGWIKAGKSFQLDPARNRPDCGCGNKTLQTIQKDKRISLAPEPATVQHQCWLAIRWADPPRLEPQATAADCVASPGLNQKGKLPISRSAARPQTITRRLICQSPLLKVVTLAGVGYCRHCLGMEPGKPAEPKVQPPSLLRVISSVDGDM